MQNTPVATDLFSRFMAAAFDDREIISVPTGFQTFFGRPETGSQTIYSPDSNNVDIDIIRGNERIAALIPRGTVSRSLGSLQKNLRSEQYSTFSRKYPLAEEEGDITGDMLLNRTAGENPYDRNTRINRLRHHALKLHSESIRRHLRMFEVLAAQAILTGKQDAIIGTTNTDLVYDFRRTSTHTATTSNSWSGASATIIADIEAMCVKVRANGKINPDMMILGATAAKSVQGDTAVKAVADNRRFEFIQLGNVDSGHGDDAFISSLPPKFAKFVKAGFIPFGFLRTPAGYELYLFTYVDGYTSEAGTFTKYIADDKVIVCSSQARCDRYFGPPENLPLVPMREALYRDYFGFDPSAPPMPPNLRAAPGVIDRNAFYADAYVSPDWKKITVRTQSAPIFATTHTDAFAVLDTEP